MNARSIIIAAATAALAAPVSEPTTNEAGAKVQLFSKDLIGVGEYVKGKQTVKATHARMDHWIRQFNAMREAGVKVPIQLDHRDDAAAKAGNVTSLFRVGDRLWARMELIGEDSIALAGRTEVSIGIREKMRDGKGKDYDDVIEHVALTSYPVVGGQGGFIRLSHGGDYLPDITKWSDTDERVPVYRLASKSKGSNMELLNKIAAALGVDLADKSEDDAASECMARIAALNKSVADTTKKLNLALKQADPPDAPTLKLHRRVREQDIAARQTAGKLNAAGAQALRDLVIGGTDNANLARTLDEHSEALLDGFLQVIDKLPSLKTAGGEVKGQYLTRQTPSDGNGDGQPDIDKDFQKQRKAALGVTA